MIAVSPLLGNIISNLVLISSSDFGSLSNTNLLIFDRILLRIFSALGGNVFPPNSAKKERKRTGTFGTTTLILAALERLLALSVKGWGPPLP